MTKEMVYIVIDGIDMRAYTSEYKAKERYEKIVKDKWWNCDKYNHGLDDYGRNLDVSLCENYTSINGKTIIMRAMFLERD